MAYVRTHDFEAVFCKDPKCGLHIFPYTKGDKPICEVVLSADDTLGLIEFCQKHLRQRNADRTVSDIPDNRRRYPAPAGGRPWPKAPCRTVEFVLLQRPEMRPPHRSL